jgi:enoyl-CoA hydratase
MSKDQQVRYETPAPNVARIVMDRVDKRNAQGTEMTYQLDAAFRQACLSDDIHVMILAGAGDHFNAGHDMSMQGRLWPNEDEVVSLWGQYTGPGWEGYYSREKEVYLEMTERWRNAPKPLIAEVQGSVMAGGNMLVWACDIVVCSEDARFRDNTLVDMEIPGVEYFAHPFEMGVRKAKEWMFTGNWMSAQEAEKCGMVNHVVPRAELSAKALEIACKIAQNDRFTLKLMKESINAAEDAMGRREAIKHSFSMHQIAHLQNLLRYGFPMSIKKLPESVRKHLEAGIEQRRAQQAAAEAAGTLAAGPGEKT